MHSKEDLQMKGMVIQEHLKQTQETQSRYLLVIGKNCLYGMKLN